jgi:drug/metabolite transporter (DMT)-like permease
MVMEDRPHLALGALCGFLAALIWGGAAVVSRHLVTINLDAADLAFLRYLGCFPVALGLTLCLGERVRLKVSWPRLAVLLLLAGPPYQALVIEGYRYTTAGSGALLLSGLLPVFALILTVSLGRSAATRQCASGVGIVLAGLMLLVLAHDGAAISISGLIIFTVAALAWAVLNECVRSWHIDPLRLAVMLALLSPLFIPAYLAARPAQSLAAPFPDLLLQIVYHGWLVALGATVLFFLSVRLAGAPVAATLQALSPGFSAILGAAVLGEPLTLAHCAALVMTIAGVALTLHAQGAGRHGKLHAGGDSPAWSGVAVSGLNLRLKLGRWP